MRLIFPSEGPCLQRRRLLQLASGATASVAGGRVLAARSEAVGMAVASSVQSAMEALMPPFTQATGHVLNLTYGASGNLVRQIEQGLPVDLFLSADEEFADRLASNGWARDRGVVYATGRLALIVARGTALVADARLQGLKTGWPAVRRFAIANPELAPYGRAAREALEAAGLWESAQRRLVLAENVAQAAQFVASGSSQAGFTALSLVVGKTAPEWRAHAEVDSAMHVPLRQRMVLRRQAGPVATAFYDYLQRPAARAVFQSHGFG